MQDGKALGQHAPPFYLRCCWLMGSITAFSKDLNCSIVFQNLVVTITFNAVLVYVGVALEGPIAFFLAQQPWRTRTEYFDCQLSEGSG